MTLRLKENKQIQKRYYDIGSRSLPPLQKGEKARVRIQGKWEHVVVIKNAKAPRSYIVRTESGKILRRNKRHLMILQEQEVEVEDVPTASSTSGENVNHAERNRSHRSERYRTYYGGDRSARSSEGIYC